MHWFILATLALIYGLAMVDIRAIYFGVILNLVGLTVHYGRRHVSGGGSFSDRAAAAALGVANLALGVRDTDMDIDDEEGATPGSRAPKSEPVMAPVDWSAPAAPSRAGPTADELSRETQDETARAQADMCQNKPQMAAMLGVSCP